MSEADKNACADIRKCLELAKESVRGAAAGDHRLELAAEEKDVRECKRTKMSNKTQPRPPKLSPPPADPAVATAPINTKDPAPETPPQPLRTLLPGHPPAPIKIVRQVMRRIQDPDESRNTEVCTGVC